MLKKIGQVLFGNFRMKLLAAVIAVGIWFYANGRVTQTASFECRIRVVPPEGYSLVYKSHESGMVRIAGPGFLLARIRSELTNDTVTLRRQLRPDDLQEGWASLSVGADWLDLSLTEREMVQLRFPAITPGAVQVAASPMTRATRPVEPVLTGRPPEGLYVRGTPTVTPSEVTVEGPAMALDALESVLTEEVPLWDMATGYHRRARPLRSQVDVQLPNGETVTVPLMLSDSRAVVALRIAEEERETRTFEDQPLTLWVPQEFPYSSELEGGPQSVTVTVEAGRDVVGRIEPAQVRPYVDLTPLAQEELEPGGTGLYQEPVKVHLPTWAADASVTAEPDRVNIRLQNPAR
ncbi:MAG: hypothetical protein R6V05_00845 [Candidatus Brocadiia bacterium]